MGGGRGGRPGGICMWELLYFCFKTAEMSQLGVNLQLSGGQALVCPG